MNGAWSSKNMALFGFGLKQSSYWGLKHFFSQSLLTVQFCSEQACEAQLQSMSSRRGMGSEGQLIVGLAGLGSASCSSDLRLIRGSAAEPGSSGEELK